VTTNGKLISLAIDNDGGTVVEAKVVLRNIGFVRVLHAGSDGVVWMGRQGHPPLRFDPRSGSTTEYPDLSRHVLTILPAGEGRLWLGGKDAGLTRFDPKTGEIVSYRHEPGNEDSLAENDVAILHQDSGGSLWVGAWNGGLSRLNLYAQAFRTLRNTPGQPDSLPDDDVTQMVEGPDGRLWTLTRNDVLAAGDPTTGSFTTIPFAGDLTSIAVGAAKLFIGTTTGLHQLDPASGRAVLPAASIRGAGLDRMLIESLEGTDGALWIIAGGVLYRLDAEGTLAQAGLPWKGEPTSLHAPSADRLWIGYAEGVLLRVEHSRGALAIRRVGDATLAARGRLIAVTEDRGVVWLGAARGLGRLESEGKTTWIDPEEGMPSRSVASILADDDGVLWIPTNQGITRFAPSTGRAVHFGAVQGTQASGYVDEGAARGRSGRFYAAGRGITVFDPRQVRDNPHRPHVRFTALEILHRPVLPSWLDARSPLPTGIHAASEVTLGPQDAVFSVQMATPGVSDPDRVHFAHRLDGFDDEWIETTADRRVATYTRLAPGRYLLRARARTQNGLWSEDEASLRIRILPPWWRTAPAMLGWALLAVLAISAIISETRRRTRVRIALAEQEGLRRASVTDPLTGLYNRRFLDTWLKHELPRTLRTHRTNSPNARREFLLLVMADLDNLKEINDAAGHDAGDRAICLVAGLLQSHARADDLAMRWGGDEFLLILRSVGQSQASHVVERLRASAENLDPGADAEAPRCTISLGFASFPFLPHDVEGLTWDQTLQLADRALLHSKRQARNAWTGFVSTPETTAAAVIADLESATDRPPSAPIRIVEGP
jgi:diguanylate cyclase (GGDEF)-like protein